MSKGCGDGFPDGFPWELPVIPHDGDRLSKIELVPWALAQIFNRPIGSWVPHGDINHRQG
ncbi:MAG: hypothetical protein AAF685_15060 [Cyanobacteria bacterium P01_C01_bin.89]